MIFGLESATAIHGSRAKMVAKELDATNESIVMVWLTFFICLFSFVLPASSGLNKRLFRNVESLYNLESWAAP